jgi:MFS transporter, FHS family, Na+ dependent glucose transporter 1
MMAPMPSAAQRWRATIGYYSLFVCLGLTVGIGGPTIPILARQTGVGLGQMGVLFVCGSIGYTAGTLLGGRLYDRLRGHALLGAAELLVAVCVAAVPSVRVFGLLLALTFCRGVAEGLVNTGGNTLLLWTHGEKASPFMNGLHFSFGLGAFVSPLLVARLISFPGGFRFAYWSVAAFAALSGLTMLATPGSPDPAGHVARAEQARGGAARLDAVPIALAALFLFSYVGGEISFGSWVYSYATTLGLASAAGAAYLTSAFWLSFTAGRLVSIPVAIRFSPGQVIPAALAGCLVLAGLLLVLPPSPGLLWAAAIGLGFCMAPLWPSSFTLAGQVVALTAFTSGLVLLGDSFGGMVLPSLTGRAIELAGTAHPALSLPLLVFGSMAVCALTFAGMLAVRKRRMQVAELAAAAGGAK